MRVAVLNPTFGKDFTKSARWFARSRGRVQRHPDYLATAAAVIEEAGHELFFMDCQAKNMFTEEVIEKHLKAFKPDLCIYQATTPSIYADIDSARLCKEALGGIHVFVAPHVSGEPESTLRAANDALDGVCRHEFDYIVRDLANGVPINECKGVSYLDGDKYIENPDMPYIENLDDLPFPAWHHLDIEDYKDGAKLFPFLTAITGRGCRYRCSYCQIPQVMKRSGCRMLCVGFEFGDQKILNNVKKGTTVDQMYTFAENAAKAKLRIHGCFMVGGPEETEETAMKTIKMSQELAIDTAQFTGVVAYPGTSYYEWAKESGALIPKDWREWVTEDFEQAATIDLPGLNHEQINHFVDIGLRKFYLRPAQIWRMLRNISSWSDVKAKYHGLKSFMGYFRSNAPDKKFVGFTGNN